jgi:GrpB-like predicted nucleotidyltransferase (UPF0157 family)
MAAFMAFLSMASGMILEVTMAHSMSMTVQHHSPPVIVVAYDPSWPQRFNAEREALAAALGAHLVGPIEHIGSTAVVGMPAKPIIDIMVGVSGLAESLDIIPLVKVLGYHYFPYRPTSCIGSASPPTRCGPTTYAVPLGSRLWRDQRRFATLCEPTPIWPRSTPRSRARWLTGSAAILRPTPAFRGAGAGWPP